jgi:SET domain-containing protein
VGPRISNDDVEKSSGKYFFGVTSKWSIDGSGRDNIARYINHSCRPNAEARIWRGRVWIWSSRNINPGEEISYHYGKEYFDGIIAPMGCRCASCHTQQKTAKSSKLNGSKAHQTKKRSQLQANK